MKKIEDVRDGRLKVDREMNELTMAFGNPKHLGCCRGYRVGRGSMLSRETSIAIKVAKEEKRVKRSIDAK
jgi:hypothetical protein